jgi:imidazoleglycerol-phosphate dehydratase/histidinol-phosphatase
MKKVLFIDRDGTILTEPEDEQVDSFEKLIFLPSAISCLSKIAKETDFEFVMVTNQDGLGTEGHFLKYTFWPVQNKMLEILKGEGVSFAEIFIDRTVPSQKAPTRKPGTAMLVRYLAAGIDLNSSFVIGDRLTDVELANNLGCKAILLSDKISPDAQLTAKDWNDIYEVPETDTPDFKSGTKNIRDCYTRWNLIWMEKAKVQLIPESDSLIICLNRLPVTETSILK